MYNRVNASCCSQVSSEPETKSDDDGAFNSDDDFANIEQADKDDKKVEEVRQMLDLQRIQPQRVVEEF